MKEEKKQFINELLRNIQKDDELSFERLFKIFYPRLLNFCNQYVEERGISEEIVNDVFTRLWINRKAINQIRNPETYLFISVKNGALNYLKQFSRYRVMPLNLAQESNLTTLHDPARETERRELLSKITEVIESLPLQCKLVFNLIKEDGLKYKEVAEILDISPRTVETQLVRAIKKIDRVVSVYLSRHEKAKKNKTKLLSIFF